MPNLLELMKPEDREKAVARFKKRMEGTEKYDNRVPTEMYLLAEFGYYFGWQAVKDIKDNLYTLEEVYPLLEGARKVWYSKLVEQARASQISTASVMAKSPNQAFKKGIKPFAEMAKVS